METKGQPPMLLIEWGWPITDRKHSLYNALENRWDRIMIPILSDQISIPCNYGWLVVMNMLTNECSLWNPESREIIQLPALRNPSINNQCVLSKPPTEPGCHILFRAIDTFKLVFCQIGDDEFVEMPFNFEDDGYVQTLKYFHGDIYALVGFDLRLVTISFVGKTIEFRTITLKSGDPWCISALTQLWSTDNMYYLIGDDDDDEEMLLVCGRRPVFYIRQFFDFKVFRIDINGLKCVELRDIGQRTIFLSDRGDAFCRPSIGGIKPNCIYYTFGERNVYVYNLNNRGTMILLPCLAANGMMKNTCWIEPNLISFL